MEGDVWGWTEPGVPVELISRGYSATEFNPDSGPAVQRLEFHGWNNAAASIATYGFAAVASFNISDTISGGAAGGWGKNKEAFVYIRKSGASFFLSMIDTSDPVPTNWTSSDILNITTYTRWSTPQFLAPTSDYIGIIMSVGAGVRSFYVIETATGNIVTSIPSTDFTTNPFETVNLKSFVTSADGRKIAFGVSGIISGTDTDRIFVYNRASASLLGQVDTGISNEQPQFAEDGSILFWVRNGVLNYVATPNWSTIVTQNEVGTDSRGVSRFWRAPRLSRDKSLWANHWNYTEGAPLNYFSRAHYLNFDFTHFSEMNVGGFATSWFKGDFDETGLWWFGGDYNINGNGLSHERYPYTAPGDRTSGGARGSPYFMRPFQPF